MRKNQLYDHKGASHAKTERARQREDAANTKARTSVVGHGGHELGRYEDVAFIPVAPSLLILSTYFGLGLRWSEKTQTNKA